MNEDIPNRIPSILSAEEVEDAATRAQEVGESGETKLYYLRPVEGEPKPEILPGARVWGGPTEAMNLIIEKIRLGHGFRNFDNYRLRVLLACGGINWHTRPVERRRGGKPALRGQAW